MSDRTSVAVVIPAYNEEATIGTAVAGWLGAIAGLNGAVVIVNDGSTDGTLAKCEELRRNADTGAVVIVSKRNGGHGSACRAGYEAALAQGFEWVFNTDADGQTNPTDFRRLWCSRCGVNFVSGQRRGRTDNFARRAVSLGLRLLILLVAGTWVKDPNVPFRLMRAPALKRALAEIPRDVFLINSAIAMIATAHEPTRWVPVSFIERPDGKPSTISNRRIAKCIFEVITRFRRIAKARNAQ